MKRNVWYVGVLAAVVAGGLSLAAAQKPRRDGGGLDPLAGVGLAIAAWALVRASEVGPPAAQDRVDH